MSEYRFRPFQAIRVAASRSHVAAPEQTMVRLTSRQLRDLADTRRELANCAAAALVFGQFVAQQALSWSVIAAGIATWFAMVLIALGLSGEE